MGVEGRYVTSCYRTVIRVLLAFNTPVNTTISSKIQNSSSLQAQVHNTDWDGDSLLVLRSRVRCCASALFTSGSTLTRLGLGTTLQ